MSASEILTVQMNTLTIGQNSRVAVTGPGKVDLHMAGRMFIDVGTLWGVDPSGVSIAPGQFVLRSCASDANGLPAVVFHQTARINGILLAPNGTVLLHNASLSRGAVLSRAVQINQGTDFTYDTTGLAISSGPWNTLTSWREQP